MRILILLILNIFYFHNALAVIFGHDSRVETLDANELEKKMAKSTPALILKRSLKKLPNGNFKLVSKTLSESMDFCPSAHFSDQIQTANCSASLIAPDKILTAGHCLNDDFKMACEDYYIVFDYMLRPLPYDSSLIPRENVFECERPLYNVFNLSFTEDIAILKLKRPALKRRPVEIDFRKLQVNEELFMIGYPLGIFQKVVTEGKVTELEETILSFKHNLDTFSVNSGGPIFRKENGKQVGVLVRGTGSNYEVSKGCNNWTLGTENDYAEGNSLLHLKKF